MRVSPGGGGAQHVDDVPGPDEIEDRGVGETQLLVPTPDNTREPQNRRVEIVLR
jgi:outer membrane protein OmpA-like peptidoglycan-associated protein